MCRVPRELLGSAVAGRQGDPLQRKPMCTQSGTHRLQRTLLQFAVRLHTDEEEASPVVSCVSGMSRR